MEGTDAADGWQETGEEEGKAERTTERGCYSVQVTKCNVREMGLGGTREISVRAPCCGSGGDSE